MHTTSKRIELESCRCLGFEIQFSSKPEQPGLSSSIRLEVVCTLIQPTFFPSVTMSVVSGHQLLFQVKKESQKENEKDNGGEKNDTNAKMQVGFRCTQLRNELS